ncbi:MAG: hypothetical protein ABEJ90_02195 [Halobacterium sp.]
MASASRNVDEDGIHFVREEDGSVTAVDEATGLERGGDTKAEALSQLAEVLALREGGGEPIEDPEEFLREELDVDPSDDDREPPEFTR